MSMILFVLYDAERLDSLLSAWEQAGVAGVTILTNTGIGTLRRGQALRDDMPLLPSFSDFLPPPENLGRTLLTILDDDSLIPGIVAATERIVGNLNEPNRGILAVLPVSQVYGLRKNHGADFR